MYKFNCELNWSFILWVFGTKTIKKIDDVLTLGDYNLEYIYFLPYILNLVNDVEDRFEIKANCQLAWSCLINVKDEH